MAKDTICIRSDCDKRIGDGNRCYSETCDNRLLPNETTCMNMSCEKRQSIVDYRKRGQITKYGKFDIILIVGFLLIVLRLVGVL